MNRLSRGPTGGVGGAEEEELELEGEMLLDELLLSTMEISPQDKEEAGKMKRTPGKGRGCAGLPRNKITRLMEFNQTEQACQRPVLKNMEKFTVSPSS